MMIFFTSLPSLWDPHTFCPHSVAFPGNSVSRPHRRVMCGPRPTDTFAVDTKPVTAIVEQTSDDEIFVRFGPVRLRVEIDAPDDEVAATALLEPGTEDAPAGPSGETTERGDAGPEGGAARRARPSAPPPQNRWLDAHSALRRGHYQEAIDLFEEEATEAETKDDHARAAVAYRTASGAAESLGRIDLANHLIRLAGKHYLFVAESSSSSTRATLDSYVTAAKCFLHAGNLDLAGDCIERAKTVERVLDVSVDNWNARTPGN